MPRLACLSCCVVLFGLAPAAAREAKQEKAIAALIEKMGDDDCDVREQARQSLVKLGEPAWDALAKARQTHADLEVRKQARKAMTELLDARLARLIGELGDKGRRDDAEKRLTEMLKDPDAAQQTAAREAIMTAMKTHKDATVKKTATDLLKRSVADRIKKLVEQLGDDSFDNRVAAERELTDLGPLALDALKQAVMSPDLETARRARAILRRINAK